MSHENRAVAQGYLNNTHRNTHSIVESSMHIKTSSILRNGAGIFHMVPGVEPGWQVKR